MPEIVREDRHLSEHVFEIASPWEHRCDSVKSI